MEPQNIVHDICRHYIFDFAHVVNPAIVKLIGGYHRSRNLAGLTSCTCHFDWHTHTINEWRFLRQIEAFYKKNAQFADRSRCFASAYESFVSAERQCSATNLRLKDFVHRPHLIDEPFRTYVYKMQKYISNVLGETSTFIEALPSLVKVTSGATSTHSRRNSLPQMKMRSSLFATRRASKYVKAIGSFLGFHNLTTKTTYSNRVELVPKNWKTDRTIACEPEGNIPLQLAFDTYAKRQLRRFGIDLSDQSCNQKMAHKSSVDGSFVTVDFKAASDTISYNTVSMVFPIEWFRYLDDVRTPTYRGKFGNGIYSKFSSMGNGSTFAIETLLFAAACYAVGSRKFSVYGDDVIIEKEFFQEYLQLTRFLGFVINEDKTFSSGPFRESCGADYFNGINVTPTYIRSEPTSKASLCHLVNSIRPLSFPGGRLERFIIDLQEQYKLPFVPLNESTLSGVWIHPRKARELGILTMKNGVETYKAYTASYKRKSFVDSRGYYLWFLNKNGQALFGGPWSLSQSQSIKHNETSWAPVFDHKYVRKRVCWHKPTMATPYYM